MEAAGEYDDDVCGGGRWHGDPLVRRLYGVCRHHGIRATFVAANGTYLWSDGESRNYGTRCCITGFLKIIYKLIISMNIFFYIKYIICIFHSHGT